MEEQPNYVAVDPVHEQESSTSQLTVGDLLFDWPNSKRLNEIKKNLRDSISVRNCLEMMANL